MQYASFDFHLHTLWSYDATAPIEGYFELAKKRGVRYLAFTEHHTMDSFREIQTASRNFPEVAYVPGAELTVYSELGSIDIVCLGLPAEPSGGLAHVLDLYHKWQCAYGDAVCRLMTEAGHPYSREDRLMLLRRYRPERTIRFQGITHVQNGVQTDYLVKEKKYYDTTDAFYDVLWNASLPHYPSYDAVIPAVQKAGGLVFLAHPTAYIENADRKKLDALRELLNFDGIECSQTIVPPDQTPVYRAYCLEHKLLSTGGTDCHSVEGAAYRFAPKCDLGVHIGKDSWRDAILERVGFYRCGSKA